jgi:hypothetical protein
MKLKYNKLLLSFAFNFNLCRYTVGASETDFVEMLAELHHKHHDEVQLAYLSHARATNELTKKRRDKNPYLAAETVKTLAPYPSLGQIDAGHGSLPTRSLLNSMVDKYWEVSSRASK